MIPSFRHSSTWLRRRGPTLPAVLLVAAGALVGCGPAAASPGRSNAANLSAPLVHFPHDQAGHADANEWWYVVGHVHAGTRTFGCEVTIFKFSNIQFPGSSVRVNIFRSDVAITDEHAHRFHQRVTYYFPQSAHVSDTQLEVRLPNARLSGATPSRMAVSASLPDGTLSLALSSRRSPMYVGGRGYLPFGDGFTYYYSLTDLATAGTLRVGGRTFRVSGTSWLDHQWGNWKWSSIRGWTWMALQLDNGVQLSLFDFRSTRSRQRAASVLAANGSLHTDRSISITALRSWVSPHTGARYPSGWRVRIPAEHAVLTIQPAMRDQELAVPSQARGSYWEGSGTISGTWNGKPVHGLSYTELTGYATGGPVA